MFEFIPDKPFLEYPEMIELLRSRNLRVDEEDYEFAVHSLKTFSYYDLINGNVDKLLINRNPDFFKDGVTFRQLVRIKLLENQLKSIFLTQILAIEKTFCTRLSSYIAKEFGVQSADGGYLRKANYSPSNKSQVSSTMKKLRAIRDGTAINHKSSSSLNHYRKYHNHIPPWILINDLTFGETIYWYICLKKEGQEEVSKDLFLFEIPDSDLRSSTTIQLLDLLREYRNFLAHNSALSTMRSKRKLNDKEIRRIINEPELITKKEFANANSQNLYACFISIVLLSTNLDQLKFFLTSIERVMTLADDERKLIFEDIFGLPEKALTIAEKLVRKSTNLM